MVESTTNPKTMDKKEKRPGMKLIFRRYIRDKKTGKIIYPKNAKAFPIWVKN